MLKTAHTTSPDLAIGVLVHFRETSVVDTLTGYCPPFSEFIVGQRIRIELDGKWSNIEVRDFDKYRQVLIVYDWRLRFWRLMPWHSDAWPVSLELGVNRQDWVIQPSRARD